MNYNQLEKCKIEIRSQLKVCKDVRLKRILTHDLQEKAKSEELTGSLI
jgi:hypothetical protein